MASEKVKKDRIFSETKEHKEPPIPTEVEKQAMTTPEGGDHPLEKVKDGSFDAKRKAPTPPNHLQLQNMFTSLKVEDEPDVRSSESP